MSILNYLVENPVGRKIGLIIAGLGLLSSQKLAYADTLFRAAKGPKDFQLDQRFNYSENDADVKTSSSNTILKYWPSAAPIFASVNIPYKQIESPKSISEGFGDLTLTFGPRIKTDNLHLLPFIAYTFPTGDEKDVPALGNGRKDLQIGQALTWFSNDNKSQLNAVAAYTFTGENDKHTNPSNELYAGFLGGTKLFDNVILGAGANGTIRDNGDCAINGRLAARYIFNPTYHIELNYDKTLFSKTLPEANTLGLWFRVNF
jgi:hypothetical protein